MRDYSSRAVEIMEVDVEADEKLARVHIVEPFWTFGRVLAIFRGLVVVCNVATATLNVRFDSQLPACCGSTTDDRVAFTVIICIALFISVINLCHLFNSWPDLSRQHFIMTGITESLLSINAISVSMMGAIDMYAVGPLLLGATLSICSSLYYAAIQNAQEFFQRDPEKIYKWITAAAMFLGFSLSIFMLIFLLIEVVEKNYESVFLSSDGSPRWSWYKNYENSERLESCLLSYSLTRQYHPADGGVIEEYCTLVETPESDYRGKCCIWHTQG